MILQHFGYVTCILKFSVTGQYIDISNFIDDLEVDDELGFEIRDFNMVSQMAEFNVYNLPLNPEVLTEVQPEGSSNTTTTDSNQVQNTVNNTTSNSTTNNTALNINNTNVAEQGW